MEQGSQAATCTLHSEEEDRFSRPTKVERDPSNFSSVTAIFEQAMNDGKNAPWTNPQTCLKKAQSPHENPHLHKSAGNHANDSDVYPACNRYAYASVAASADDSFSSTDTVSTVAAASPGPPKMRSAEVSLSGTAYSPVPTTSATPVQPYARVTEAGGDTARADEPATSREVRSEAPSAREPLRELVVRPRPLQSLPFA